MNKIWILLLLFSLLNCSFDTRSGIWSQNKKIVELNKNTEIVFIKKKTISEEFNSSLNFNLNLTDDSKKYSNHLSNNLGLSNFNNEIKSSSKFKFSKIKYFDYFEPNLVSDGNNFAFFDDRSNLLKFNEISKIVWKKNFYEKHEKKLKPILTLALHQNNLVVIDSIGKIYNVNFSNGNLIWSKININPFNSQLKIYKNKIYAIDMNNILICYSLKDGKELWKFKTDDTFLKSNKRNSLVIKNDIVYFNNSLGDIVAVNAIKGSLIWQLPTQNSNVYENAFGLKMSDLVISGEDIIFSNNRNEFYSFNLINGVLNWKQNINSSIRPIIINNHIFTFSNEGYFFLIDRKSGNIIRITNTFKNFNKNIYPIGFIVGQKEILLSTSNGRLLIIDIATGKTKSILKIDNDMISRPFVFNKQVLLVKNNSIIRLN